MRRRRRAAAFLLGALLAAAVGAAIASRYGSSVARGYGSLRPVVVASAGLAAGKPLDPRRAGRALLVRRVPERFAPPDALAAPREALGLAPRAAVPAGSYLVASRLRAPAPRRDAGRTELRGDRRPVEVEVSGAGALAVGRVGPGARVDVVVTGEPRGPGPGPVRVAAPRVPLLALGAGPEGPGPGRLATAVLGLTRPQALRLIAADSFARRVTLLPAP